MSETNGNISVITSKLADLENLSPDETILKSMLDQSELILARQPLGLVGGIDSSDNLLLNIPDHPGAAIAGYSFSLIISDPDGKLRYVQDRMAEKAPPEHSEPLEISLIYRVV